MSTAPDPANINVVAPGAPPTVTITGGAPTPAVPTQVKHPWRTLARTVLQNLPTEAVVITAITQAAQDNHVGWVEVWGPSALAVSVVLTRISAIPGVNDLLTKLGLGATPKA